MKLATEFLFFVGFVATPGALAALATELVRAGDLDATTATETRAAPTPDATLRPLSVSR
jgi:hypothetical protein